MKGNQAPISPSFRYEAVVAACALDVDIARMGEGDLTPIGDKGGTLSGGQRSRLALARFARGAPLACCLPLFLRRDCHCMQSVTVNCHCIMQSVTVSQL